MTESPNHTNTPQEYLAHVGNLESQEAIAHIAQKMITHEQSGLRQACVEIGEEELLRAFETLLNICDTTSREQWAELKESFLLLLGSPIASCVDHLISGLRTPANCQVSAGAIAGSAIRSAGIALIDANEDKARKSSQNFIRQILVQAINTPNRSGN